MSIKLSIQKVEFPLNLDLYSMCSPDLRNDISPARERIIQVDQKVERCERLAKLRRCEGRDAPCTETKSDRPKDPEVLPIGEDIKRCLSTENEILKELGVCENIIADVGANHSGMYSLAAVLTHEGRTADYGHYVTWAKYGHVWYKFDDKNVSIVRESDIEKLSGGGDWHSGLSLFPVFVLPTRTFSRLIHLLSYPFLQPIYASTRAGRSPQKLRSIEHQGRSVPILSVRATNT